eukprot:TCONS_00067794-protein
MKTIFAVALIMCVVAYIEAAVERPKCDYTYQQNGRKGAGRAFGTSSETWVLTNPLVEGQLNSKCKRECEQKSACKSYAFEYSGFTGTCEFYSGTGSVVSRGWKFVDCTDHRGTNNSF